MIIVRSWVESGGDQVTGLVAELRDPRLARALLALHLQPGRDWSVAELAAEARSSRSALAECFQRVMGLSSLRQVTDLRMRMASQWLAHDRLSIGVVAQRLGYASQAVFSRARKRMLGWTQGSMRQRPWVGRERLCSRRA